MNAPEVTPEDAPAMSDELEIITCIEAEHPHPDENAPPDVKAELVAQAPEPASIEVEEAEQMERLYEILPDNFEEGEGERRPRQGPEIV